MRGGVLHLTNSVLLVFVPGGGLAVIRPKQDVLTLLRHFLLCQSSRLGSTVRRTTKDRGIDLEMEMAIHSKWT